MNDMDAQASRDALIAEARSIQRLLVHYQKSQEELQKDVDGFVQRDIEEEAKGRKLYSTVALAELELCQNVEYLKFEKENSKVDCVIPSRRMRAGPGVRPAHATRPFTMARVCQCSAGGLEDVVPLAAAQLRDFGDLVEYLLGWRRQDESGKKETELLCDSLYSGMHNTSSRYVICCNGLPLIPSYLLAGLPNPTHERGRKLLEQVRSAVPKEAMAVPFTLAAAVAAQVFYNAVLPHCAFSREELCQTLLAVPPTRGATTSAEHIEGMLHLLSGDVYDNLTMVEEDQLRDTQLFRGFFFMGQLRVVEHLGPEVDVMGILASEDTAGLSQVAQNKAEAAVGEQQRLRRTFAMLFDQLAGDNKVNAPDGEGKSLLDRNVCLVAAVRRERGGSAAHTRLTVLDIRPITPTLPFHWQLSWEELCAVGQRKVGGAAAEEVLFKLSRVSVTELNPYDALSAAYFPIINKLIER